MGWALALRRREEPLLLAAAGLALAALALSPLVALSGQLASAEALRHAARALSAPRTWLLLLSSLGLASAVTLLALGIGLPLGVLLGRADLPLRRLALGLHAFPLFLPPFLLALGWFHLLGRGGIAASGPGGRLLFSAPGAVLVLALALTPVVTSLVAVALRAVDPSLEEAALLVAGPGRAAARILLPLIRPAIALAALIVFSLAFSELGVPMFLRVAVYPALVFSRLGGVDFAPGEAFALAAPLFAVAAGLLAFERRAAGRRSFAVLGLRSREVPDLRLGRWRLPAALFAAGASLLPLLPLAALALRAARGGGFAELPRWIGASAWYSLLDALGAGTVVLALAIVIGHAAARRRRGGAALDALAVLAFVTPAAVLGVGLVAAWNRPSLQPVYGSSAMVGLALAARHAAVALRTAAVSFAQGSAHHEEAAAIAGARFLRRLGRILVPLHARGLAAAWLLAVVFCLRDLETAVLLYPAGQEPLTVRIFTLEANGPGAVVAALSCAQVAMTAAVLALGAALLLRRGR
ncbi:ABC transporter permease [Anaeromyxobacter diazotrophicus]|uniref:ABC transporter permease n=2 Tax=Anaeromyxobacter diazotrophicus TaxID=2590199 RepID=A0A7I9VL31_9BACT|nr:ABC transporter permease [Anaeromyxobacter diazotrophicus]